MRWAAGLLGLAAIAMLCLWLARKPIAKSYIASWCAARDLTCDLKIERLGFAEVKISDVKIDAPSIPDLVTLASGTVTLDWPRSFSPAITAVQLYSPNLKAQFDGSELTVGGLEKLANTSGGEGGPSPDLTIQNGKITLSTPAGALKGDISASGKLPSDGELVVTFAPAELASDGNTLSLQSGSLNVSATDSILTGQASLEVAEARFGAFDTKGLSLNAALADATSQTITWNTRIDQLTLENQVQVSGMIADGTIQLRTLDPDAITAAFDMVNAFSASGSVALLTTNDTAGEALNFLANAQKVSADDFTGNFEAKASAVSTYYGGAKDASITWSGRLSPTTGSANGGGNLVLQNANLSRSLRDGITSGLKLSGVFEPHFTGLRTALDQGLKQFSSGLTYQMEMGPQQNWQFTVTEKVALRAESGLTVLLNPARRQGAALSPNGLTYSGVIDLSGGGAPKVDMDVKALSVSSETLSLNTGGFTIAPWTEAGVTLASKLNRFSFSRTNTRTNAEALGELSLDGTVFGLDLKQARVFGGVSALQGKEGWRVQTLEQDCLGLDVSQMRVGGTFSISGLAFPICPEDGRFIRQQAGYATGKIGLGDVTLNIAGTDTSGRANFKDADLSWSTENGFAIDIQASTLDFPATIGSQSLRAISQRPRVSLLTASETGARTQLSAGLGRTSLSGSLIPANVSITETRFSGQITGGDLQGDAATSGVRITDINSDPLYRPLIADFSARLDGTGMTLSGPISLDRPIPIPVADVNMAIDLIALNGKASVTSRDIIFSKGGLEPRDLSDRMRDIFSSGRGLLRGKADFDIKSGALSGKGEITAEQFGFDTFRIGSVDGVNGTVKFDDIIALSTPPKQQVSIQRVNPGILLQNGTLTFQVLGGREALIESAVWPFAGGTLEVEPSSWTIAGIRDVLRINARNLELTKMIEELSLPDVQATGTVSGSFPLELRGGKTIIQNARLTADAKGGTLKYTGGAVNQAAAADETVNAAFTALRDFRFKVLEIGVNGDLVSDIVVRLNLLGFNPEVLGGAEFKFNVEIDSKLAQLIKSGQDLSSSKIITETAVNEVKANAANKP